MCVRERERVPDALQIGKIPVQHRRDQQNEDEVVSRFFCRTCSLGIIRIRRQFDLKCVVVLLLTLSIFVCALFWALPLRSNKTGFDAKDAIKLGGESLFPLFCHQI